jgi:hypothetical protein
MNAPFEFANITAPRIKRLNEKAVIMQLRVSRPRMSRRDKQAEDLIKSEFGDDSYTAYSRLFKHSHNPVHLFMQRVNEVYGYHIKHTYPSLEKGQRILAVHMLDEYKSHMREMIEAVNREKSSLIPIYDQCVQLDINDRTQHAIIMGKPTTVSIDEYPTAEEFFARTNLELRMLPLPDQSHFLFDVDESDVNAINSYMRDIEAAVRVDTVKRLLDPVGKLIEKCGQPVEKGERFYKSIVTNVVDAVEMFKKLSVDEDPALAQMVRELDTSVKSFSTEALRDSDVMRQEAREKLQAVADKMSAFL